MNDVHAFAAHEQLHARERWRSIETTTGPLNALVPPVDLAGVEPVMGPVPAVGEHTERVLSELGYSDAAIERMRASGAI